MNVRRVAALLILIGLASGAIAASVGATPETASSAGAAQNEWKYSCGGLPYPLSVFDRPTGADRKKTAAARALRHLIAHPGGIIPLPERGWRLAAKHKKRITFTAFRPWRPRGIVEVSFRRGPGGKFHFRGSTYGCSPSPWVRGHRVGAWELDPDYAAPDPSDTQIRVLVDGTYCASGEPPLERIREPMVSYGAKRLVIATVEAPPAGRFHTCLGSPPSKFTFTLSEPIGNRLVLDGTHIPFPKRLDLR